MRRRFERSRIHSAQERLRPIRACCGIQGNSRQGFNHKIGGAGIRSIEYDGQSKAFRILTGAAANGEKTDFKLWKWNGDPDQSTLSESDTFDRTLKPEGVTRFTSANRAFTFIVFDTSGYTVIE